MTIRWNQELYSLGSYTPQQVQLFCVQDAAWQVFRKSLKGTTTQHKLLRLEHWWRTNWTDNAERQIRVRCQVTNYLYALKRGGQLGDDLEIRK